MVVVMVKVFFCRGFCLNIRKTDKTKTKKAVIEISLMKNNSRNNMRYQLILLLVLLLLLLLIIMLLIIIIITTTIPNTKTMTIE